MRRPPPPRRRLEERSATGEDVIELSASERVDVREGTRPTPYATHRGDHLLRFCLVYTSMEEVLPRLQQLWALVQQHSSAGKAERAAARRELDELIREHEGAQAFAPGWLEREDERVVIELPCASVTPLASQPGRAVLTQRAIYFQPFSAGAGGAPIQSHALRAVSAALPRTYQLEPVGLELFLSSRHSLYLAFRAPADRDAFAAALLRQPGLALDREPPRERWTRDWVAGRLSNFEYLMHLNREAGRSFKDLTQYPVSAQGGPGGVEGGEQRFGCGRAGGCPAGCVCADSALSLPPHAGVPLGGGRLLFAHSGPHRPSHVSRPVQASGSAQPSAPLRVQAALCRAAGHGRAGWGRGRQARGAGAPPRRAAPAGDAPLLVRLPLFVPGVRGVLPHASRPTAHAAPAGGVRQGGGVSGEAG